MQHIAKEGRCFVISVNQFCKVSDFPADYPPFTPDHHDRQSDGSPWTPDAILSRGGSCVVGPFGAFIEGAEPVWDKEHIVYAELNRDDLVEARVRFLVFTWAVDFTNISQMEFDVVGSYSRPDIL